MITKTVNEFLTNSLPNLNIAVIGDVMVDRYVFGDVSRISPEAPVPVNRVSSVKMCIRDSRVGGVIMPITTSLAKAFGSEPQDGPRKIGSFLMQSIYQVNTITSAMFQTSMAGNTCLLYTSPDFNQPYRFSFLPSTTPLGVPVKIISPSCSVIY